MLVRYKSMNNQDHTHPSSVHSDAEAVKIAVSTPEWREAFRKKIERSPENMRRWEAGLLAIQYGYGGVTRAVKLSGLSYSTVCRGKKEIINGQADWDSNRVRKPGGGRKLVEENDPRILDTLDHLLDGEIAGDPNSDDRWINRSTRKLEKSLRKAGHRLCYKTVRRIIKKKA